MLPAFGATLYIDLVAGNITILEQVLIWGGLITLLNERTWLFSLLNVVAALFKTTPLLFLALATATSFPTTRYLQYSLRYYPHFLVVLVRILLLRLINRDRNADATTATAATAPAT